MIQECKYCKSRRSRFFCNAHDILHGLSADRFPYYRCTSCGCIFRESSNQEDSSVYYPKDYAPYIFSPTSVESHSTDVKPNPEQPHARNTDGKPLAVAKSGQGKRWGLGRLADPKRRRKWIRDEAQRLKIRAQQRLNRQAPDIYSIAANAIQAGDKVCDFGCGSPRFLSKIQELVGGIRLTGVDFVEHDARAFEAIGASFMPADKFWDSDETYGLINMNHVLEHIPDPDAFLLRIRGKLAPGGYLLIATPNAQSLWAKIFSRCWFALDCPRHINIPSLSSLLTITGRLNYKVEISALQFKYNDFSRSLLSLQCEQSSSSYQERLESLYGSKDSIKLQRAKQKELAFLKDLFMIRLWFIGSAVSRLWEGSDRIILLLSSKDFS